MYNYNKIGQIERPGGKRNLNIECLRVMMMLLIVIMHLSGHSVDMDSVRSGGSIENYIILAYRSITYLGVPTFAFISGYYGISFKFKKLINMEIMAITYGVMVILFCILLHLHIKPSYYFYLLFPASSMFLWYYSSYVYLFLISPFINLSAEKLSKKDFEHALIGLLIVGFVLRSQLFGQTNDFMLLLSIYLVGRYLKIYPIKFIQEKSFILFISLQTLNIFVFILCSAMRQILLVKLWEGTNILTFSSAICVFYIFLKKRNVSLVTKYTAILGPYMLSVYILHALILRCDVIDISSLNGKLLYILPISILTLLVVSLIEKCRLKLMEKIEQTL